jgi:hypothetical protein
MIMARVSVLNHDKYVVLSTLGNCHVVISDRSYSSRTQRKVVTKTFCRNHRAYKNMQVYLSCAKLARHGIILQTLTRRV